MIAVIGEILIDVFEHYNRIGGAPFNFAFHLKQLGWPVRFLTRIGDDAEGKTILALLEQHQFNLEDVQIDPVRPTGTVQVSLDARGVPEFDIRTDVAYDYLELKRSRFEGSDSVDMVYYGSLIQRTPACFQQVRNFVSKWDVQTKVFCDINLRPPYVNFEAVEASLKQAHIVKLSDDEFVTVKGRLGGPDDNRQAVQWMLRTFDIEKLVVTKGARGSSVHTAKETVTAPPAANAKIVDTVGAGDAYAAVMAAGILKGCRLQETITAAADFAARICALPGAVPEARTPYDALSPFMKGDADAG